MSIASGPTPQLTTAEEFARVPDSGVPTELVRGEIVEMPPAGFRHRLLCSRISFVSNLHLARNPNGVVTANDTGVITARGPDSVRGPGVSFYSRGRLPEADQPQEGYAPVAPDVVFEVLSPSDRWVQVLAKVSEYLGAGVSVVCAVDPGERAAVVYRGDEFPRHLHNGDESLLREVGDDFHVADLFVTPR